MDSICLRKELENLKFSTEDLFSQALILLGCSVCKKIKNHEEIDKYSKILIMPLLMSFRKYHEPFFRATGSIILENIAAQFSKEKVTEDEIKKFLITLESVAKRTITLRECIGKVSESVYCETLARLYFNEEYELIFALGIAYALKNIDGYGGAFRINLNYKGRHFFHIGVSLDEGHTENFVQEVINHSKDLIEDKFKINFHESDAYFFEMKLYRKMLLVLKIEKKEIINECCFGHGGLKFLFDRTSNGNYCDVYELLSLSDAQKWKEANSLLKRWGDNINDY